MRRQDVRFTAAFAFVLAISVVLAEAMWAAPPARIASLNLCTDELLLAIADPAQIATVTHLARDPRETVAWRRARAYPANDGTILSVVHVRPDLIVTMGGAGRDSARLAAALGAELLVLPFPARLEDVLRSISRIGQATGQPARADALVRQIEQLRATAPRSGVPALFVGNGGRTLSADGAGAAWLSFAGFRQLALPGDRLDREQLLRLPPMTLIESDYRIDQYSRATNRPLRRTRDRRIATDGRRWTCMGPSMIDEIMRLRRIAAR